MDDPLEHVSLTKADRAHFSPEEWEREAAEAEAALHRSRRELRRAEEEHAFDRDQLTLARRRLVEQHAEMQAARERLDDEFAELRRQRRRVARALARQHASQKSEIAQREVELQKAVAAMEGRIIELATAASRPSEFEAEVAQMQVLYDERGAELDRARVELEELREESERLRIEQDQLSQRLAIEAPKGLEKKDADNQGADFLNRRLELAMQDMRALRHRNAELEEQLKLKEESGGQRTGAWNWEMQKKRWIESLETDEDASTEENKKERISLQETIRVTDELLAQKDAEITDLKQQLSSRSSESGPTAAAKAMAAELFDKDEIIGQERERLEKLQVELHEKLRQAEIQLAVDRARMTRQQAEINEKLQLVQAHDAKHAPTHEHGHAEHGDERPDRARWLSMLGLKDHGKAPHESPKP